MDTNFAGSHRVSGRRRRRLASESETPDPMPVHESPDDPVSTHRTDLHAETDETQSSSVVLPLSRLIPVSGLGYLFGGVLSLCPAAGLVLLSRFEPAWLAAGGPRLVGLFSLPESTAAAWYAALLMGISAQLSLLIWWGRSRSLKDFDGRYRLWWRMAVVWLGLSFCTATRAHRIAGDLLLRVSPVPVPRGDLLAWFVPAAITGIFLLMRLYREMSGCRTSRNMLLAAATAYALGGVFEFPLGLGWSVREQALSGSAATLLGHWLAFMSMWLHARHVLHCNIDPTAVAPRRREWIQSPHFTDELPTGQTIETDANPDEPRERKQRKRKTGRSETVEDGIAEPVRIEEPVRKPFTPIVEHSARPEPSSAPAASTVPAPAPSVDLLPASTPSETEDSSDSDDGSGESGWNEPFPKPDMRGMSKKQRRRLMQELRERERAGRRS